MKKVLVALVATLALPTISLADSGMCLSQDNRGISQCSQWSNVSKKKCLQSQDCSWTATVVVGSGNLVNVRCWSDEGALSTTYLANGVSLASNNEILIELDESGSTVLANRKSCTIGQQ